SPSAAGLPGLRVRVAPSPGLRGAVGLELARWPDAAPPPTALAPASPAELPDAAPPSTPPAFTLPVCASAPPAALAAVLAVACGRCPRRPSRRARRARHRPGSARERERPQPARLRSRRS